MEKLQKRIIEFMKLHKGIVRTRELIGAGFHTGSIYKMRDIGLLTQVSRGCFVLFETDLSEPDLVAIASQSSKAVVALISALSWHECTTQVPHAVHIALPAGLKDLKMKYPPLSCYHFSGKSYSEGIEVHTIDGIEVKIYSLEKTIADCFKFRNSLGTEVVVEALKLYLGKDTVNIRELMHFVDICRVRAVITPYLEAMQ
ncbi:MAG: type IV toxin-antitoxin system AbiEi family antitoxin domain-containing protein [Fibrobacterales bacterium]